MTDRQPSLDDRIAAPLVEQIEAVEALIRNGDPNWWRLPAMRAVLATLQQHERAMKAPQVGEATAADWQTECDFMAQSGIEAECDLRAKQVVEQLKIYIDKPTHEQWQCLLLYLGSYNVAALDAAETETT